MRIEVRDAARADLHEFRRYITADNPEAARRVIAEIRRQIEQLRRHPLMGRPRRVEGTRELVVSRYPYVVAYQLAEDSVDILAVIRCARLWPEVL